MIEQERQALEFPPKERFPAADISNPYFEKCVGGQKAPLPCPPIEVQVTPASVSPNFAPEALTACRGWKEIKWDLLGNTEGGGGHWQLLCRAGSSLRRR